jgi:uncharacterized protein YcfL
MRTNLNHKWLLLIATTVLLAACGGHHNQDSVTPTCVAPQVLKAGICVTEPPVTMIDTFTKYVSDLVANLFDDKEPIDITTTTVTTPDDKEPEIIK